MTNIWVGLAYIVGVAVVIIVLGLGLAVAYRLAFGSNILDGLVSEPDGGKASLSRFQFLIFTFVVAGLFLLLSIEAGSFVEVPPTVLGLIGISGGSFVISKGISNSATKK